MAPPRSFLLAAAAACALLVPAASASAATPAAFADAVLQDPSALTAASAHRIADNGDPIQVVTTAGAGFPTHGTSYGILDATSGEGSQAGEPYDGVYDLTTVRLDLAVPNGTTCLTLDFRFATDEGPGAPYNDGFVAELDGQTWSVSGTTITAPNNFAQDGDGRVVSVNSEGLGLDAANAPGTGKAHATSLLRASTPITSGPHQLYLSIFDHGDGIVPSAALIDAVRFGTGTCTVGASVSEPADTTPPDTTITSGPDGTTTGPAPAFAFTSTEDGSTFECRSDAGAWSSCTSPSALSGLASGARTFEVRATDVAGNVDPSPAARSWTVDATAPAATIDSGPSSPTNATSAVLVFAAGETATYTCSLDGASFASCTSPVTLTGLAAGSHTFAVRATDAHGNVQETAATRTWVVDTTAPAAPVLGQAPAAASSDREPSVAFTADDDTTLECRLDDGEWAVCTSPLALTGLPDGTHVVRVRARDAAGNASSPVEHEWRKDTTAPAAPAVLGVPQGPTTATEVELQVETEQDGTAECRLDGGAWAPCAGLVRLTGLSVGEHRLEVRQTDAAGNVGEVATATWTVAAPKRPQPQEPQPQPQPKPAAAAPVTLQATVGDAAERSGTAAAVEVTGRTVTVGCQVQGAKLRECEVRAYEASAGRARAAAGRLIGTGTVTPAGGRSAAQVPVRLNALGRRLVARSAGGLRVRLEIDATTSASPAPLRAERVARLVVPVRSVVIGPFAGGSPLLDRGLAAFVKATASRVGRAKAVTCTGHAANVDRGPRGRVEGHELGMARARAVCAALKAAGVRARLVVRSPGETRPRASNATAAGMRANRRVVVTVAR